MEYSTIIPIIAGQVAFWSVFGYGMYRNHQRQKQENEDFNRHKQNALDIIAEVESPEYQAQFAEVREAVNQRARQKHFLAIGRPDLAHPEIYATAPAQPLETRLNDVNSLYRFK